MDVVNKYFDDYLPLAVANGLELRRSYNLSWTWMTQSWLISLFFDCPPSMGLHCPNQTQLDLVRQGIAERWIYWHAFPFNSQVRFSNMLAQKDMPNEI